MRRVRLFVSICIYLYIQDETRGLQPQDPYNSPTMVSLFDLTFALRQSHHYQVAVLNYQLTTQAGGLFAIERDYFYEIGEWLQQPIAQTTISAEIQKNISIKIFASS